MRNKQYVRQWAIIILLGFIGIILSACSLNNNAKESALPDGTYEVDAVFRAFYNEYGGADFFGYAISSAYTTRDGKKGQYIESVLMVYDMASQTVSLEAIGRDLGVGQLPIARWEGARDGGIQVGTYFIYPAFAPLYISLTSEITGQPLSEPFYNAALNRIEQHFENLGFYLDLNDPNAKPALLYYGRLHCPGCSLQNAPNENAIIAPVLSDASIYATMMAMGVDYSVVGELVNGPSTRYDGRNEIIFDYMVMYEQDGKLDILDAPVKLGLKEDKLYHPLNDALFVFYEIENGIGHNVFHLFDDYIRQHGGYQISGDPIRSLIRVDASTEEVYQCFENYCLNYTPATGVVRPVMIGDRYFELSESEYVQPKVGDEGEGGEVAPNEGSTIDRSIVPFTVIAQEDHYSIDSQTTQVLTFWVRLEDTPQPGMELVLTLIYPDGSQEVVSLPPTDQEGKTTHVVGQIEGPNGGLVQYEACLTFSDLPMTCVDHIFMIWGNP